MDAKKKRRVTQFGWLRREMTSFFFLSYYDSCGNSLNSKAGLTI